MIFKEWFKISKNIYQASSLRLFLLIISISIILGISFYFLLWSKKSNDQILYSQLDSNQINQISQKLKESNVSFRVDHQSRSIYVPNYDIDNLRIKFRNIDKFDDNNNFEFLNKENNLASSRFMESARYKHILEIELSRTITRVNHVKSSRVHLAIPKETVFVNDKQHPTASVFLDLENDHSLSKQQILAIQNLVGMSIPNLLSKNVSVIDQNGNLLSSFEKDELMSYHDLKYIEEVENNYQKKIINLLAPILGDDNIRANVEINFNSIKNKPDMMADLRNYENRKIEELNQELKDEQNQGGLDHKDDKNLNLIKTLSIAVLLDNMKKIDQKTGNQISVPLTKTQISNIEHLIKMAVGFNEARGDKISVLNIPFLRSIDEKNNHLEFIKNKSHFYSIVEIIFILFLILFFILFFFKTLKLIMKVKNSLFDDKNNNKNQTDIQLSNIERMIEDDPVKVSKLIKSWIGEKSNG